MTLFFAWQLVKDRHLILPHLALTSPFPYGLHEVFGLCVRQKRQSADILAKQLVKDRHLILPHLALTSPFKYGLHEVFGLCVRQIWQSADILAEQLVKDRHLILPHLALTSPLCSIPDALLGSFIWRPVKSCHPISCRLCSRT